MKKRMLGLAALLLILLVAACSSNEQENESTNENEESNESSEEMDHSEMNHSSSGEVPDDLEEAEDPSYEVDSTAVMNADHMPGMDGAEATISGAFDTVAYIVSYDPANGGERVEDHKWVIHEELEDPGEAPLEEGAEVTLNASHMEGMEGAEATIDSAEETTVYMVDFEPTDGGEKVENHKWVTESELSDE
ncbi:YdhK family protein [Halobacillus sp. A1]|uniref:YdhK family protein n=1 Tax=Halobacillus sp. A1 TaxID=2880262 RepID=UPI0020A6AC37|nr:YdhK family protein [Halobacillus sp. A1]MCP3031532.1 YdhK family protein [Halobacillus sp. A1]